MSEIPSQRLERIQWCWPCWLAALSLAVGWTVPFWFEFFDDPSDLPRVDTMEKVGVAFLVVAMALTTIGTWQWRSRRRQGTKKNSEPCSLKPQASTRFGIKSLFLLTTIAATGLALAAHLPANILAGFLVNALAAWLATISVNSLLRYLGLLGAMFFPFFWIFPYSEPFGRTSGMLESIGLLPGLIPAVWIGSLIQIPVADQRESAAAAATVLLLIVCFILAGKGRLTYYVSSIVILAGASFSSLVFHALYRM